MSRYRETLLLWFCFLVVPVCYAQPAIDEEEYLVYSFLIQQAIRPTPGAPVIIFKITQGDLIDPKHTSMIRTLSLDTDLISNFNARNSQTAEIGNNFKLDLKVLVLDEEVRRLQRSVGDEATKEWKDFRKRYGTDSVVTLSRVGFNKRRDRAILLAGNQYGWLGGEGFYYLLEKRPGTWRIKKRARGWIS